jgi:hypothetical protein
VLVSVVCCKVLEMDTKTEEYVFHLSPIQRLGIVTCFYGEFQDGS